MEMIKLKNVFNVFTHAFHVLVLFKMNVVVVYKIER
jgi:hypothetical protein